MVAEDLLYGRSGFETIGFLPEPNNFNDGSPYMNAIGTEDSVAAAARRLNQLQTQMTKMKNEHKLPCVKRGCYEERRKKREALQREIDQAGQIWKDEVAKLTQRQQEAADAPPPPPVPETPAPPPTGNVNDRGSSTGKPPMTTEAPVALKEPMPEAATADFGAMVQNNIPLIVGSVGVVTLLVLIIIMNKKKPRIAASPAKPMPLSKL